LHQCETWCNPTGITKIKSISKHNAEENTCTQGQGCNKSKKNFIKKGFMICTPQQVLLGRDGVGHVACIKAMRSAYRILVTKPKRKRLSGTTKSISKVNI
jgi:hypothetical protein